jgi:hypothetical protein
MRSVYIITLTIILLFNSVADEQSVSSFLPNKIEKSGNYLFYLHGGVVTVLGNNAINKSAPDWGPYEYLNILDSLKHRGFNIVSENRKEGIDDFLYNPGRKKVLKHFLDMKTIFKTAYFQEKYERQARINLASEMETLRSL